MWRLLKTVASGERNRKFCPPLCSHFYHFHKDNACFMVCGMVSMVFQRETLKSFLRFVVPDRWKLKPIDSMVAGGICRGEQASMAGQPVCGTRWAPIDQRQNVRKHIEGTASPTESHPEEEEEESGAGGSPVIRTIMQTCGAGSSANVQRSWRVQTVLLKYGWEGPGAQAW